jgi:hypothetical protein
MFKTYVAAMEITFTLVIIAGKEQYSSFQVNEH